MPIPPTLHPLHLAWVDRVTALGQPQLLERCSTALREMHRLFVRLDADGDGQISRAEFRRVYRELFTDGDDPVRTDQVFDHLSSYRPEDYIDFIDWTRNFTLLDLPEVLTRCRNPGPLHAAAVSPEEIELLRAMLR